MIFIKWQVWESIELFEWDEVEPILNLIQLNYNIDQKEAILEQFNPSCKFCQ